MGGRLCFSPLSVCPSVSMISQKLVNGFRQNLEDGLGVRQGRIDSNFGEDPDPDSDTRII